MAAFACLRQRSIPACVEVKPQKIIRTTMCVNALAKTLAHRSQSCSLAEYPIGRPHFSCLHLQFCVLRTKSTLLLPLPCTPLLRPLLAPLYKQLHFLSRSCLEHLLLRLQRNPIFFSPC